MLFFETSAYTGLGINDCMKAVAMSVVYFKIIIIILHTQIISVDCSKEKTTNLRKLLDLK